MKQIWLDDIHSPLASNEQLSEPIWVKTGEEFIDSIDNLINSGDDKDIDLVSFDNDLGLPEGLSGTQCFNYLEQALNEGFFKNIKTIVVHSDNLGAVGYMMSAKQNFSEKYGIDIIRRRRVIKE